MQEYSVAQLAAQMQALGSMFDEVSLVDPAAGALLDPQTLEATGAADEIPQLDERGRAWQPLHRGAGTLMAFYQAITVGGRPCVLMITADLPHSAPKNSRDANAFLRMLTQYRSELCHDYVTGVYNRAFLDTEYRSAVAGRAAAGEKVCAVMAAVNEYADICSREGNAAADRCLNTAAGILQIAVGMDDEKAVLVRIEDGVFLAVAVGQSAGQLIKTIRTAMEDGRKTYSISLSRRGEFTVRTAGADWGEAGSWDRLLALAEQRLRGM